MKNPTMVYKYPGNEKIHGVSVKTKIVEADDLNDYLKAGWAESPSEALDAIDEVTAPTREELEAKAAELGIDFTKRTKDETLLAKIEAALAEQS